MSNKDQAPFDIPDPEAAGWKEDPDRPGYWLWENEHPVNEAPDDGKQYGRQSSPAGTTPTWTEIVIPPSQWNPSGGGINTNASKVIVGTEGTEGVGLYANGSLRVWETSQNNNYLWTGYGGASITSHIQADGDAKFSGTVDCGAVGRLGFASFGFSANAIYGRGSNNVAGGVDLGTEGLRWANAYFGGMLSAGSVGIGTTNPAETLTVKGPVLSNRANYGANQNQAYMIAAASNYDGSTTHWGSHGFQHRLKSSSSAVSRITVDTINGEIWSLTNAGDATFAGTVTASAFVGDGSALTGIDIPDVDLTGYATQTWVTSGFQPKGSYLTPVDLSGYATQTWVTNKGYATQTWVTSQGYLKAGDVSPGISATDVVAVYYGGAIKGYSYASGFRVTGNMLASGDVYAYYSDERLKTKTGEIENALDKVESIDCFYYTHNDIAKSLGYEGDDQQVGVSAQSVKAVMPECVGRAPIDDDGMGGSVSGEDYMTVKYERLVPLLLQSIKELRKEVEELKRDR